MLYDIILVISLVKLIQNFVEALLNQINLFVSSEILLKCFIVNMKKKSSKILLFLKLFISKGTFNRNSKMDLSVFLFVLM